jgi:hypothetical protein
MSMEMKLARLESRVARMEKQAMLKKIKQAIVKVVRELGPTISEGLRKITYGANNREIQREMDKLRKDPYFQKVLENAPRRGSIKKLWSYFKIYLKKAAVLGLASLKYIVPLTFIAIIQVKFPTLGFEDWLWPGALAYAANIGFYVFERDAESYLRTDEKDYYARELAKQRLLNER